MPSHFRSVEGKTNKQGMSKRVQPQQRWTREQQLELLDTHPMFTGKCPSCGAYFNSDYTARVHWDCECGWMDDKL